MSWPTPAADGKEPSPGDARAAAATGSACAWKDPPPAHAYPVSNVLELKHERLSGVIARYSPVEGWGLLRSHMFEGEVAFRTDRMLPEFQAHPLRAGESVEFDVQADDLGQVYATALKPVLGRRPHDIIGQRHRGYVRRFADRWGFLNSAAFDGDLFVHRDNLLPTVDQGFDSGHPALRAGQAVEFDVALDDRGRAVAKQITTRTLLRPNDWIGHRLRGYIRSFQGAWGFINSERFAGDLFVHRDSLVAPSQHEQLVVGTVVEFDIERDHHRKSARDRLVARNVAVLVGETAAAFAAASQGAGPPTPAGPPHYGGGGYGAQALVDPATGLSYGALANQPGMLGAQASGYPPYAAPPYYGQSLPSGPPLPTPVPYAQPLGAPLPLVQPQYGIPVALPRAQPQLPTQPPPLFPNGLADHGAVVPVAGPGGVGSTQADGQPQGLLHMTMHDWEPDQPGQLWVTKGTLVSVSYKAAHGWVYAGTVQPGTEIGEPASEGWIPQAVVKRVSLCRVNMDWPPEGSGTLGVSKGEIMAVSREAERGWVYGERIGPRLPDCPADGWLPRKVLDVLQA